MVKVDVFWEEYLSDIICFDFQSQMRFENECGTLLSEQAKKVSILFAWFNRMRVEKYP